MRMQLPVSALASWPLRDLDLALAEVAIEADTGRYGESLAEATSPGADPSDYSSGLVYVAHGPFTNWAERAAAEAEEAYRKSLPDGKSMPRGLFWTVSKEMYTPVPAGEVVEVQLEQAAYGLSASGSDAPDTGHDGDDDTGE